jgi:hypothetical protein
MTTMHVIEDFSIQKFRQIKHPEENYSSRLFHKGFDTGVVLKGLILEAQFVCGHHYLMLLTHDCPFEETLSVYLLDQSFNVLDRAEIFSMFTMGILGDLKIENDREVSFTFFSSEEKFVLTVLPAPQRVLTHGLKVPIRRPFSIFSERYFDLFREGDINFVQGKYFIRAWLAVLISYLPLGILLGVFMPDNILDNSLARGFTDMMSAIVPLVRETGRRTTVPATQFVAAVMNLVAMSGSLLLSIIFSCDFKSRVKMAVDYLNEKIGERCLVASCAAMFCTGFFIWQTLYPYAKVLTQGDLQMLGSKLGMGIYGGLVIAEMWWLLPLGIFTFVSLMILLKRHLQRKKS